MIPSPIWGKGGLEVTEAGVKEEKQNLSKQFWLEITFEVIHTDEKLPKGCLPQLIMLRSKLEAKICHCDNTLEKL